MHEHGALVEKALKGKFIIQDFDSFTNTIDAIYQECIGVSGGQVSQCVHVLLRYSGYTFRAGKYSFFSNKLIFMHFIFIFLLHLHYSQPHPFCTISFSGLILGKLNHENYPVYFGPITDFAPSLVRSGESGIVCGVKVISCNTGSPSFTVLCLNSTLTTDITLCMYMYILYSGLHKAWLTI